MPWINKIERKERNTDFNKTDRRKMRIDAYNDRRWCGKNGVRIMYLREHPLCEECMKKGKTTAGTSVHHIKSPFKGDNVDWVLMLDYNNLETVCNECHADIHNRELGNVSPKRMIEILDSIFEDIEDENK